MNNQRTPITTSNECRALADPRHYGKTFTDPICHLEFGHTGCHVGTHVDGTQTGFNHSVSAHAWITTEANAILKAQGIDPFDAPQDVWAGACAIARASLNGGGK